MKTMHTASPSEQRQSAGILRHPLFHLLLIACITVLAYSNTFQVPFVFDDVDQIVENPIVKDLDYFLNPAAASDLPTWHGLKMRTLGYLSLAMNYRFGGLDVTGYHVFNLAVHVLSAFLVYGFLRLTLRTPFFEEQDRGSRFEDRGLPPHSSPLTPHWVIPLFVALLFAVHPIQTQAVTYVIQRLASMAAFFCLLSLTSYIKARLDLDRRQVGRAVAWLLLAVASAAAAMKTKEIAFTLPVVIALYEFIFFRARLRRRLAFLAPILLTLPIIPLSLIGTSKPAARILGAADAVSRVDQGVSRLDYLTTQFRVIVTYLRMLVLPTGQNVDHGYPLHPDFFAPDVFASFLFLAALFALGIYFCFFRGSSSLLTPHSSLPFASRLVGFGILWFFITLSVESSIIPIDDVMFEHRLYLPSVGFFLAVVAGGWWLAHHPKIARPGLGKAAAGLSAALVLALSGATYARNQVWTDKVGLWRDVVAKSPGNARAWNNLGSYYDSAGDHEKAIAHFRKALEVDPDFPQALFGMGIAHAGLKQLDEAIRYYRRALEAGLEDPKLYYNLGVAYISKGRWRLAAQAFRETLSRDPDMNQARMFLDYATRQIE